jgi:hypothetical protein
VQIETNGGGRQALVPPNLDKPFCSKSSAGVNKAKKRKYCDEYLNLGFVQAGTLNKNRNVFLLRNTFQ